MCRSALSGHWIVEFEFDPAKSKLNSQSRGFAFAAQIFFEWMLGTPAPTVGTGDRTKAIGRINGLCSVVMYTDREAVRRIVSARRVNRRETSEWHASA